MARRFFFTYAYTRRTYTTFPHIPLLKLESIYKIRVTGAT